MFMHEITINDQDLKLRIQAEIMRSIESLRLTNDIGYTSWEIADKIVEQIKDDKKVIHRNKNNLDYLKVEL